MKDQVTLSIESQTNKLMNMNINQSFSHLIYFKINECFSMSRYDYSIYREIIWGLFRQLGIEIKCVKCDVTQQKSRYRMSIHHKDGNYDNNVFSNLEILCKRCHGLHHMGMVKLGLEKRELPRGKDARQWVERVKTECYWCKKGIERTPRSLETMKRAWAFCSKQCFFDNKRAEIVKNKIEKACSMCNQTFMINPLEKKQFCSKKCATKHTANSWIRRIGLKIELKCKSCLNSFFVIPSLKTLKYCSRSCVYDAMRSGLIKMGVRRRENGEL